MYTVEPVRDRDWWVRTACYWLVLATQALDTRYPLLVLLAIVPAAAAVYVRDRLPWVSAAWTLLTSLTIAETPVAVGMVVLAGRARRVPLVLVYAAAGAAALLVPWPKLVGSGLRLTSPDPTGIIRTILLLGFFIVVPALIGLVRRANRETALDRLRLAAEQRELAAAQAVTEERNRIAQEMHDVLGHQLSLITVQAGALEVNATVGVEAVREHAALIRITARQALDELRGILGMLGTGDQRLHPQPGLAAALELVEQNRTSGLRITVVNHLPEDLELPAATEAAVHRIVAEGLTNVLRHAPGAAATLTLVSAEPGALRIELVNRPAARRGAGPGSGRGLPGLRERVRSLGGTLDAGTTAEGGYRLAARLPLARQAPSGG